MGILGVVADLIKVESSYETAIETALGGSIQNIVTDREETAKRMIEFLKRGKYGRATFLPLTAIGRKRKCRKQRCRERAGDFGRCEHSGPDRREIPCTGGIPSGRTLVADNMDHAIATAREISPFSADRYAGRGEGRFHDRWCLPQQQSNLLGRRREVEELQKRKYRHWKKNGKNCSWKSMKTEKKKE